MPRRRARVGHVLVPFHAAPGRGKGGDVADRHDGRVGRRPQRAVDRDAAAAKDANELTVSLGAPLVPYPSGTTGVTRDEAVAAVEVETA